MDQLNPSTPFVPNYGFYRANLRRQKGYGLGGIFGTLARYVLPFFKQHVLPHAKRAIRDIAVDIVDEKVPLKEAVKHRATKALKSMGSSVLQNQTGSGRRRVRRQQKPKKSKHSHKIQKINKRQTQRSKRDLVSIFDKNAKKAKR